MSLFAKKTTIKILNKKRENPITINYSLLLSNLKIEAVNSNHLILPKDTLELFNS